MILPVNLLTLLNGSTGGRHQMSASHFLTEHTATNRRLHKFPRVHFPGESHPRKHAYRPMKHCSLPTGGLGGRAVPKVGLIQQHCRQAVHVLCILGRNAIWTMKVIMIIKFYLLILGNVAAVSHNCLNSAWYGKIKVLNIIYRQIFPGASDDSDLLLQVISGDDAIKQLTLCCNSRFNLCQTFSIIFKSGDCAGHVSVFILFRSRYSMTEWALWTGALSSSSSSLFVWMSWKMQLFSGKCCAITGHKLPSSISIYLVALIFPSTKSTVPTPKYVG